jgi:coatomer subunit delta
LAAFPKLMNAEKEHTFIETDSVRYVYQPMESLYMLVITNKSSNIMEDLDTLHLLAKLVCRSTISNGGRLSHIRIGFA